MAQYGSGPSEDLPEGSKSRVETIDCWYLNVVHVVIRLKIMQHRSLRMHQSKQDTSISICIYIYTNTLIMYCKIILYIDT